MSTSPDPDHRIAVVLATEEGRTAVVALISDRTGPVDSVILERPPRHNRPQSQRPAAGPAGDWPRPGTD